MRVLVYNKYNLKLNSLTYELEFDCFDLEFDRLH